MALIILVLWFIVGWLMGTVLNFLADQLPEHAHLKKLSCSHCGNGISWVRFLTLERCGYCNNRRSSRSWIIQLGLPVLSMAIWTLPHERIPSTVSLFLLSYFILVCVIDIEHRLILGQISLVGVILGVSIGIFLHDIPMTLIGGAAGAGIMLGLYQMGRLFSHWVSQKRGESVDEEALGFGDVYIAAIIGLILGWPGITAGLFIAILGGGLVSGLYLLGMIIFKKYKPFTSLPYAPFLLLAAVVLIYRP